MLHSVGVHFICSIRRNKAGHYSKRIVFRCTKSFILYSENIRYQDNYSKFAWLPIGRHYVIAVGVSTHYYPELTQYCNTITTWPEKDRENGFSSSCGANSNRGSGYCWSALPFITTAPHVGRVIRDPDQATGQRATYWSQEDHHYLFSLLKSNFKPKPA